MVNALRYLLLALPVLVVGCAPRLTPEARCFADATVDYRAAWREARALEADLARGYALHRQSLRGVGLAFCSDLGPGSDCLTHEVQVLEIPVPLDRDAAEARLAALRARMDALRPAAMARAAPCGYGDWSEAYLAALEAR